MPDGRSVAGVVLAAGAGRRLGAPKALVELGGELLVERAVRTAAGGGCDPVFVVLGSHADEVLSRASLAGARPVIAADWSEGMGASLRAGIDAAESTRCPAIVVSLVDQPRITAAAIRRLIDAWIGGAEAAVATYDGKPRNPVLLARTTWDEVRATAIGDTGAREWLRANRCRVVNVACDEVGDPADIDTPLDLEAIQNKPQ
jgi:nicotine blue oxidoreductase